MTALLVGGLVVLVVSVCVFVAYQRVGGWLVKWTPVDIFVAVVPFRRAAGGLFVLLLPQEAASRVAFELPTDMLMFSETPHGAARRVVRQETGLEVGSLDGPHVVSTVYPNGPHRVTLCYWAEAMQPTTATCGRWLEVRDALDRPQHLDRDHDAMIAWAYNRITDNREAA